MPAMAPRLELMPIGDGDDEGAEDIDGEDAAAAEGADVGPAVAIAVESAFTATSGCTGSAAPAGPPEEAVQFWHTGPWVSCCLIWNACEFGPLTVVPLLYRFESVSDDQRS